MSGIIVKFNPTKTEVLLVGGRYEPGNGLSPNWAELHIMEPLHINFSTFSLVSAGEPYVTEVNRLQGKNVGDCRKKAQQNGPHCKKPMNRPFFILITFILIKQIFLWHDL